MIMKQLLEQISALKDTLEKTIELEEKINKYELLEQKIGMSLFDFVSLYFVDDKGNDLSGKIVEQDVIEEIKTYFRITNHALEKLKERTNMVSYIDDELINYSETVRNIKYEINHRLIAYYNTDGSVNIAIDRYNYFVFKKSDNNNVWFLITFKEKSYNDNDIFYKKRLAELGYDRKEIENDETTTKYEYKYCQCCENKLVDEEGV